MSQGRSTLVPEWVFRFRPRFRPPRWRPSRTAGWRSGSPWSGASHGPRAGPPRWRPVLRPAVRADAGAPALADPAPLPERALGHRGGSVRAVDPRPAVPHRRGVGRGGEGVRDGGLPAPARAPVRLVRLPPVLPGLGRRPEP